MVWFLCGRQPAAGFVVIHRHQPEHIYPPTPAGKAENVLIAEKALGVDGLSAQIA